MFSSFLFIALVDSKVFSVFVHDALLLYTGRKMARPEIFGATGGWGQVFFVSNVQSTWPLPGSLPIGGSISIGSKCDECPSADEPCMVGLAGAR